MCVAASSVMAKTSCKLRRHNRVGDTGREPRLGPVDRCNDLREHGVMLKHEPQIRITQRLVHTNEEVL